MRECEAVIVMPSFVPAVKFDITTNWERLAHPGSIRVDYVKMINNACRVQKALAYSGQVTDRNATVRKTTKCCRAGWHNWKSFCRCNSSRSGCRFLSWCVATNSLTAAQHLPPELHNYYGIDWLTEDPKAAGGNTPPATDQGQAGNVQQQGGIGFMNPTVNMAPQPALRRPSRPPPTPKSRLPTRLPPPYLSLSPAATSIRRRRISLLQASRLIVWNRRPPQKGQHRYSAANEPIRAKHACQCPSAAATPTTSGGSIATGPTVADVMVISRELLRVKLTGLNPKLTNCCVLLYAATPAGISNPLTIPLNRGSYKNCGPSTPATVLNLVVQREPQHAATVTMNVLPIAGGQLPATETDQPTVLTFAKTVPNNPSGQVSVYAQFTTPPLVLAFPKEAAKFASPTTVEIDASQQFKQKLLKSSRRIAEQGLKEIRSQEEGDLLRREAKRGSGKRDSRASGSIVPGNLQHRPPAVPRRTASTRRATAWPAKPRRHPTGSRPPAQRMPAVVGSRVTPLPVRR